MSIELTDEMVAPAEKVVIDSDRLTEGDAIDLAWDVVKAAAPLIEAAVREQVAREIERHAAERKRWSNETARARGGVRSRHDDGYRLGVECAARIARGEQS